MDLTQTNLNSQLEFENINDGRDILEGTRLKDRYFYGRFRAMELFTNMF